MYTIINDLIDVLIICLIRRIDQIKSIIFNSINQYRRFVLIKRLLKNNIDFIFF